MLNFGCGATFHQDWVNLDASPVSPEIIAFDISRDFPFEAGTFDAVYGSHVLEHLDPYAANDVLRDCNRILKPGGIIRVAVPDLERIARLYLSALEEALAGDREAQARYDWLMLELYDQSVRKVSGGKMSAYVSADRHKSAFVAQRLGCEGVGSPIERRLSFRISRRLRSISESVRKTVAGIFTFAFLGPRGLTALREGLFRSQGEIHQWMYDRFSMARALQQSGFTSVSMRIAGQSDIPGFQNYHLEVIAGQERKPDSLYMEGRKPVAG
jgi:predicted SAM-dependent methyltransferase